MLYKIVFAASTVVGFVFADEKTSYDSWDESGDSWDDDDPAGFFDNQMCGAGQCPPQPQCGARQCPPEPQCGAGQCGVPPTHVVPPRNLDDEDEAAWEALPDELKQIELGDQCGAMCQASKMASNAFGAVGDALGFGGSNNDL